MSVGQAVSLMCIFVYSTTFVIMTIVHHPTKSPSPSVLITPYDPPLHALTVSELCPDGFLPSLS